MLQVFWDSLLPHPLLRRRPQFLRGNGASLEHFAPAAATPYHHALPIITPIRPSSPTRTHHHGNPGLRTTVPVTKEREHISGQLFMTGNECSQTLPFPGTPKTKAGEGYSVDEATGTHIDGYGRKRHCCLPHSVSRSAPTRVFHAKPPSLECFSLPTLTPWEVLSTQIRPSHDSLRSCVQLEWENMAALEVSSLLIGLHRQADCQCVSIGGCGLSRSPANIMWSFRT